MCEYNYTTLDVMADLTFGEPLNLHDSSAYRPWVEAIFGGFKYTVFLHAIRYFPWLEWFLVSYCIPQSTMTQVKMHRDFSKKRVDRRVEAKLDRPDIWGLALAKDNTEAGLTRDEMYANSDVFMVAGTETTGTLISGLTYYLLTNPEKMKKLTSELRTSLQSEDAITVNNLLNLKYLNACIEEGLRIYPPAVHGFPRVTPQGSTTIIDGHDVPPGVCVLPSLDGFQVATTNSHLCRPKYLWPVSQPTSTGGTGITQKNSCLSGFYQMKPKER